MAGAGAPSRDVTNIVRTLTTSIQGKAESLKTALLPTGSEHHYNMNASQEYKESIDGLQQMARELLVSCQAIVCPSISLDTSVAPTWSDLDEVQGWVTAVLDEAATAVDTALDRHRKGGEMLQANFSPSVDNSTAPFVHWASHVVQVAARPPPMLEPGVPVPAPEHPLQHELDNLTYEPWQLQAEEPILPGPLDSTPLHMVDNPTTLQAMVDHLADVRHMAIDLENHSFRSFQGFTCLMQISTRTADFVVDTLALRNNLGPALQPILANTSVVKVLHGADSDVLWLQRDFHLYLVNMFDTGQAARVLGLESAGLAHLVQHYCGVRLDKQYQMADWRARPLAPELLAYARSDTHYLLYIYDRLKRDLIDLGDKVPASRVVPLPDTLPPGALSTVLERSRVLCNQLYEKEKCDDATIQVTMDKWQLQYFAPKQQVAFHAVMKWRDTVCREEDEGTGYVLPRAGVISLAKQMPVLGKDVVRMVGTNPSEPLVRRAHALASHIAMALATVERRSSKSISDLVLASASTDAAMADNGAGDATAAAVQAAAPTPCQVAALAVPALVAQAVPKIQRKGRGPGGMLVTTAAASSAPAVVAAEPAALTQQPEQQAAAAEPAEPSVARTDNPKEGAMASQALGFITTTSNTAGKGTFSSIIRRAPSSMRPGSTPGSAAEIELARVRASFALPFLKQAPASIAATSAQPTECGQLQGNGVPTRPDTGWQGSGEKRTEEEEPVRTTAQDVRGAIEALKASGQVEVILDADGQQEEMEEDQQGEDDDGQAGEEDKGREGQGEMEMEEGLPGSETGRAGGEVGIPQLEFVPMSLREMKDEARRKRKPQDAAPSPEPAHAQGGTTHTAEPAGTCAVASTAEGGITIGGNSAVRETRCKRARYRTGLEQQGSSGADKAAVVARPAPPRMASLFGSDDEDEERQSDDSESDVEVAPAEAGAPGVVLAAKAKGGKKADGGKGRGGRGQQAQGGRGGRGGAKFQDKSGSKGGRNRGKGKPAFNPYDIPDENLVKGGKRSAVMPRSGNRTMTFK